MQYVTSRKTELDEDFVKYLHYLMEAEKVRLRDGGVPNPDREPSNWLMILEIVKKGVYHELAKAIKDDVSVSKFSDQSYACLHYLPTQLPTYLLTLHTYLSTYLPTYLVTYSPTFLSPTTERGWNNHTEWDGMG